MTKPGLFVLVVLYHCVNKCLAFAVMSRDAHAMFAIICQAWCLENHDRISGLQ